MANEIKNERIPANFPGRFGKRENRASTHNYSCLVADSDYDIQDDDGVNFVVSTAACEIKLPAAASNAGRVISFNWNGGSLLVTANADGASFPSVNFFDAATECADYFCTGSEWLLIRSTI